MFNKNLGFIIFCVGIITQIFVTLIYGNIAFNFTLAESINSFVSFILGLFFLTSIPGIFFGVNSMLKEKKIIGICVAGIVLNVLWLLFSVIGITMVAIGISV